MALKQLMIARKLREWKEKLEQNRTKAAELATREAELETAIEEAKTEEEIQTVEASIEELEQQQEANEQERADIEGEIATLEAAEAELRKKEPPTAKRSSAPPASPAEPPHEENQYRGGTTGMTQANHFRNYSFEQRRALAQRTGVKEFLEQVRALGKESQSRAITGAELTIPDVLLPILRDNLHRYSKLIQHVNKRRLRGTSRQNITGPIPEAIWTEACASLNELELLFKQIEADGYKLGGFIPICNATLEDSDENLAVEILEALSQALGLGVDKAILYGTGKKMPTGIATRLAQTTKPDSWGPNAPDWVDLHESNIMKINPSGMTPEAFFADLILKLARTEANYSNGEQFWAMNKKTRITLLTKLLTFNAAGSLVAALNNTMPIIGGDIVELPFIPDGDIIGGYGSLYLLIERSEGKFARSEHARFVQDETLFKGTARYDGKPIFGEGFVIVNIQNNDPATSVTFAPDTANQRDAYLSALTIGSLTLLPSFNAATLGYTATTANASNTVTATAAKAGATVVIKNGEDIVNSGSAAEWEVGVNTLTITVTYGTTVRTYTVTVTRSGS